MCQIHSVQCPSDRFPELLKFWTARSWWKYISGLSAKAITCAWPMGWALWLSQCDPFAKGLFQYGHVNDKNTPRRYRYISMHPEAANAPLVLRNAIVEVPGDEVGKHPSFWSIPDWYCFFSSLKCLLWIKRVEGLSTMFYENMISLGTIFQVRSEITSAQSSRWSLKKSKRLKMKGYCSLPGMQYMCSLRFLILSTVFWQTLKGKHIGGHSWSGRRV